MHLASLKGEIRGLERVRAGIALLQPAHLQDRPAGLRRLARLGGGRAVQPAALGIVPVMASYPPAATPI
jgi:hypothetical protein